MVVGFAPKGQTAQVTVCMGGTRKGTIPPNSIRNGHSPILGFFLLLIPRLISRFEVLRGSAVVISPEATENSSLSAFQDFGEVASIFEESPCIFPPELGRILTRKR